jgi:UDP-glucose 4-epimerase
MLIAELRREGVDNIVATGIESHAGLPDDVLYVRADLTHSREVRQLLFGPCRDLGVERIAHLAFHRHPGGRRAHKLHVDATRLILRLVEEHPTVRRFVHRSTAEVYATRRGRPDLLREDHALEMSPRASTWVRHCVEADVSVCTRMGMADLGVAVLRCAEVLAPDMGSQLYDYLGSRVCLLPLGFDPIVNLLSLDDVAQAFLLALRSDASGVFNIPGADTLPLTRVIRNWGRTPVGVPDAAMGALYRARSAVKRTAFRYDLNRWRFHFNGVLDGSRAEKVLGYRPRVRLTWPGGDAA